MSRARHCGMIGVHGVDLARQPLQVTQVVTMDAVKALQNVNAAALSSRASAVISNIPCELASDIL